MCSFCEKVASLEMVAPHLTFPMKLSVALIDHLEVNGEPRGKTIHYKVDGLGYALNFCPECGKKLN